MLPLLLGVSTLLVNINTAIQIGIVNQQYARAQTFILTYNSPFYPALWRPDESSEAGATPHGPRTLLKGSNQMVLGVSDNAAGGGGDYSPIATQQMIVRKKSLAPPNAIQDESAKTMGWVRIRNTVTLCTNTFSLGTLVETTNFSYICGSGFSYDP